MKPNHHANERKLNKQPTEAEGPPDAAHALHLQLGKASWSVRWDRAFAVQPGCGRLDVDVAYSAVEDVPMESGLKLGTVVCLDRSTWNGASREH